MNYQNMLVRRNPDIAWQEVSGNTIVVTPRSKKIHILSGSGSRIFEYLSSQRRIDEVVRFVCEEYEVDCSQASVDTQAFVRELMEKEILLAQV